MTTEGVSRYCFVSTDEEALAVLGRCGLLKDTDTTRGKKQIHDILQPYFLYVGNAYPHKNLERICSLAMHFPEYRFVLVGREDFFYQRLKERYTSRNLCFTGFVTDTELAVLYRYGVAYIFPSLYEGFGLPPLEAMNYGLPVVSSDRGSLPEVLGRAALYVDAENEAQFIVQLQKIATDEPLRLMLRKRGYRQIRLFSWERMARQTYMMYTRSNQR